MVAAPLAAGSLRGPGSVGGPGPAHVEPEALHLDPQLVELGLVDDPQDLADVVVGQRHGAA